MSRAVRAAGGEGRRAERRQIAAGRGGERHEVRPAEFFPPLLEAEWFGPRGDALQRSAHRGGREELSHRGERCGAPLLFF